MPVRRQRRTSGLECVVEELYDNDSRIIPDGDTAWNRGSSMGVSRCSADRFNEIAARLVAAANAAESTAVSSSSSTSTTPTATFSTDSATSQSAVTNTTSSQPAPTGIGAEAGSNSNHSDPKGPLVGGVVGGVLGFLLIGALIFYILLRHRRPTGAAHAQPDAGQAALSAEGTISRSGTPGPYGHPAPLKERMMSQTDSVVCDLDGPRTFPPQMGMAAMGGSVDGHMREMTVASEGYEMREI